MTAALRPEVSAGGLLRVITAGSVDDGKSTLIGRLLYDSKAILADQIASLRNARHKRSVIDESDIDLALLTDGLEAEREQGITIDVAYRYFSTASRKFILADAPGHEQYTRNMVTGASNSDAAVILIDASRVTGDELLEQTHRHLVIASLLGVHHLIVTVNKMDLIGYDPHRFQAICRAVQNFVEKLGRSDVHYVPVSALRGCNVVRTSSQTPWYTGPALLELLESLPPTEALTDSATPLRFPVQIVLRANGSSKAPFRAFAGRVESGNIAVGDTIVVLPAGHSARVQRIWQFDQQVPRVAQGSPCAIELDRDIDASRGDLVVRQGEAVGNTRQVEADLCWLDGDPLIAGKKLYFRHGTSEVQARVSEILYRSDIRSLERRPGADGLQMNEIARVRISLAHPVAVDRFDSVRPTGRFVLVDAASFQTSAAGLIRGFTA